MRERLRRLHIDGREFVWKAAIRHVPGEGDCHRGIRLRVWGSGKNGRILQADLLSKSWPAPWGACATDDAYPTPAKRPANSRLDTHKLQQAFALTLPDWRLGVARAPKLDLGVGLELA